MDIRNSGPFIIMPLMLIAVQLGGLLLSPRMEEAGLVAFEDPSSIANPLILIGVLLLFTLVLLIFLKFGGRKIIPIFIGFAIFFTFIYIYSAISGYFLGFSSISAIVTFGLAIGSTIILYIYPEWYIIDILGILLAAGITSIFGISLNIIPVLVLLVLLAVYDAISVYKTRHMITLAEGVIEMKTPILVVVPKRRDYSYIREGLSVEEGGERGAFVMGMGDLIMPSILVVSATVFLTAPTLLGFITIPSVGAMAGSLVGLAVLINLVVQGRPQAGLPALNGGAITGFLLGCALTGTWSWIPGI